MTRPMLSRREALLAAAALPLAPALLAGQAHAAAPRQGPSTQQFNRFAVGEFEVTSLLVGTVTVERPHEVFGLNVSAEEFAAVSRANFLPADRVQFYFTPTLVNTGSELVLFDTGLDGAGMTAALAASGVTPDQIDVVVLTYLHPDHIGGLMTDGTPTFANARYVTGGIEHNYWRGAADQGFETLVKPLEAKTTFLDAGGSVAPGITAMAAFGHTPGHMIYRLDSAASELVITADTANHYVWSLAHPDWEVQFDADKAAAAAARKSVFGMLAADHLPFLGYHMPFPALGFVEAQDAGFRYVPASYQMNL